MEVSGWLQAPTILLQEPKRPNKFRQKSRWAPEKVEYSEKGGKFLSLEDSCPIYSSLVINDY
jgi:hypothetical protein